MTKVFLLHHVHEKFDGEEDVKLIGVYSSAEAANHAIARARSLPGFSAAPNGFHVESYELDVDHWNAGFVTVLHG